MDRSLKLENALENTISSSEDEMIDPRFKDWRCNKCGGNVEPSWFELEEVDKHGKTGRIRTALSNLVCVDCLSAICVDDSFDGPWRMK